MNKNKERIFSFVSLLAFIVTMILSLIDGIFIPSCMLMLSLFLFSICYIIKDDKKIYMYMLFLMGILLIIGSLVYTYVRVN